MNHQSLRLTLSNSPFFANSTPRSPTRSKNEEPGLRLSKVIGTTTTSSLGFDAVPFARQFAYVAGAAAVVAEVGDDLTVTQRFFRARPAGLSHDIVTALPSTPTASDPRHRVLSSVRDHGAGGSPLGSSRRDWSNSPAGKTTTAKDRVKAATSVALSPNGKWVAIGETGYKPRVLIFSNTDQVGELPCSIVSEHSFGVHALAFSADSRYLASLGTVNDGFLYIWSIDHRTGAATLHSSNKCTSTVNAMLWTGHSLLTIGLRFVKVWRPETRNMLEHRASDASALSSLKQKGLDFGNGMSTPKQRVLQGKNCLLSDLLSANFVCGISLDQAKAIICTDSGDICLVSDFDTAPTLTQVASAGFSISAVRTGTDEKVHFVGPGGRTLNLDAADLVAHVALAKRDRSTVASSRRVSSSLSNLVTPIAVATIGEVAVELDSKRGIRVTRSGDSSDPDANVASRQIPAHNDVVAGVQSISSVHLPEAAFLTYSSGGAIQVWAVDGTPVADLQIPVESSPAMFDLANEVRTVAHIPAHNIVAAGDKYGTLSLVTLSTGALVTQARAHSAEVVGIVAFERDEIQLLATASRDRTIQLFTWQEQRLELVQTMDDHASAVTGLLSVPNGELLLSYSTDRSIIVREATRRVEGDPTSLVFVTQRILMLKSSPNSVCWVPESSDILVSTSDRMINKYNIRTGQTGFSFKCSDAEGGEAVAMARLVYAPSLNGNPTICGISSSDKSVRLYSEFGSLIARDWGHTEGVTDIALISPREVNNDTRTACAQLVTVAADSTVFIWDTLPPSQAVKEQFSEANGTLETPTSKPVPLAPPLRKVLSYSELSRFKRDTSSEDLDSTSPTAAGFLTQPSSPQRLRKKSSRTSIAEPPRLEPTLRTGTTRSSRRSSITKRSPSPTSSPPRSPLSGAAKRVTSRRPSMGTALRSKSSDNVHEPSIPVANAAHTKFGSLSSSTESVCRTLRAYRKRLANIPASDKISQDTLRELEQELELTMRLLVEKSSDKTLGEPVQLRQTSKVNGREERSQRRSPEGRRRHGGDSSVHDTIYESNVDAVTGALEEMALES